MKTSSKLLIAASMLAASGLAGASTVTFTFNTETLPPMYPGSNGATSPNLLGISPGYYNGFDNTYNSPAGTLGIYNDTTPPGTYNYGLGVTSPSNVCGTLPANTSTVEYRCASGSTDAHYVDNSGNGATVERRTRNSSTSSWGSWRNYQDVRIDDFVRFQFDTNVLVTSITLGIWDYQTDQNGGGCKTWRNGIVGGSCREYYDLYFVDVSYNTGDANSSPWSHLQLNLGTSAPASGQEFTFSPFGLYTANDWLGFGAGFGNSGTGFKIKSLTVETAPEQLDCNAAPTLPECSGNTVPEPGTLSSLGLAALAMAAVGRLRRRRTA
jgi:hypothetical protein